METISPDDLGGRVGMGGMAEILDYGDGKVVKLFKTGYHKELVMLESSLCQEIFLSGAPVPRIFGCVRSMDQYGFIMEKFLGRTLNSLVADGCISLVDAGYILAETAYSLHNPGYMPNIRSYKEWFLISIGQLMERGCPIEVSISLMKTIHGLPEGRILCHGDLHTSNIIMTHMGPRLVDWANASLAEPYLDIARVYSTYQNESEGLLNGFLAGYSSLAGLSTDELHARMGSWLPLAYARRLLKTNCRTDEAALLFDMILRN